MRFDAIIPMRAAVVALLVTASAAYGQDAPATTDGLRATIPNINSSALVPAAPVVAKTAADAATDDGKTTAKPATEAVETAPDPVETGTIVPEPVDNARVAPVPMIDTSDPPNFIAGNALRRTPDEDPFAPLGIRAGSFLLFPEVGFSTGYTTNTTNTRNGNGAGFAVVAPQILMQSDWSRHEATLLLRGSQETFSDKTDDVPEAEAAGTLLFDLADRWNVDLQSTYRYGRESLSDPDLPGGVDKAPDRYDFNNSAALNGAFGRNVFTFEAKGDRSTYSDAKSGGKTVNQGDRDNTLYGVRLRTGYEVTRAFTPFVEGVLTNRVYDQRKDDNGLVRTSNGNGLRAGFAFDRGPVSTGEIAIGYMGETFQDKALKDFSAMTVDGLLAWAPTQLTTITTSLSSSLDPTTDRNSSGSIVYDAKTELAYAWRANADLAANAGVRYARYQGTHQVDWTYQLGLDATWKLNRYSELAAGYVHEWRQSTDRANDYSTDTIRLNLRIYR